MKKILPLLLIIFLLQSCKKTITSDPIAFKTVLGIYEIKYNDSNVINQISLIEDSTYFHKMIQNDSVILEGKGVWSYEQYTNYNIVILYNYTNIEDLHLTKKAFFYACKRWWKISLANNINADPDGAPSIQRYKKIE